jgi:hypothetical protein
VANLEAKLSQAVYSAVSKSVYGMAQLQVPKEGEAKNDDKDGSKDSKRSVHASKGRGEFGVATGEAAH